jgi:hypothetical protein
MLASLPRIEISRNAGSALGWMSWGILIDQMPSFLGVPNCD